MIILPMFMFMFMLMLRSCVFSYNFDLRADTKVFFVPRPDRVIIIFGLDFTDKVDIAIAKVFMQVGGESQRFMRIDRIKCRRLYDG